MNQSGQLWRGSFPSIVTPFRADGAIDEKLLRDNIELTLSEGVHGIVIGAHNGESPLMDVVERISVMRIGIDQVKGRIPVLCGAEHVRTDKSVELVAAARDAGAQGVVVEAPAYMRPSDEDVVEHFMRVGRAGLPMMIYNQPHRSGFSISGKLLEKLMEIKEVVALMDSAGDFVRLMDFIRIGVDRISVFVGNPRLYGFPAVVAGARGFVDGIPQVMGRDAISLYELAEAGKVEEARVLQDRYHALGRVIYERVQTHAYPATLKAAMNLLGRPGGFPRLPLRPVEGAALERLESGLREVGL